MSDVEKYRVKAVEYSNQARQAATPVLRERWERMERSCLLISKNAAWLESTDEFLRERRGA